MRNLAMIVRADQGGLGNQTWEMWRALRPEHTIVIQMDYRARGCEDTRRYDVPWTTVWTVDGPNVPMQVIAAVSVVCDVLLTVETFYCDPARINGLGMKTLVVANPELVDRTLLDSDAVVLPTNWEFTRLVGETVTYHRPQPVAMDRFIFHQQVRQRAATFYHPCAPAMLDRNGTQIVLEAMQYVQNPCKLIVRGYPDPLPDRIGNVEIQTLSHYEGDYWAAYPQEADVLLMPRRYGGLCLPVLEASALGMPAVMTALHPQLDWAGVAYIPAFTHFSATMKGGRFAVYDAAPQELAATMDRLMTDDDEVRQLSVEAIDRSHALAWDEQAPHWCQMIGDLRK